MIRTKVSILVMLFFVFGLNLKAQMLTVKKIDKDNLKDGGLLIKPTSDIDSKEELYKIVFKGYDSDKDILTYPFAIPDTVDKLSLIRELLTFE